MKPAASVALVNPLRVTSTARLPNKLSQDFLFRILASIDYTFDHPRWSHDSIPSRSGTPPEWQPCFVPARRDLELPCSKRLHRPPVPASLLSRLPLLSSRLLAHPLRGTHGMVKVNVSCLGDLSVIFRLRNFTHSGVTTANFSSLVAAGSA